MGKSVIKIDIKTIFEGKEMISEATMDLKELQKIVSGFINEKSAAYATQIEAEAKLETVTGRHFGSVEMWWGDSATICGNAYGR